MSAGPAHGLRVLLVVQRPQRRGAEVFARDLSRALRASGAIAATCYLYPFDGPSPLALAPDDRVLGGRDDHPMERLPGIHPGLLRKLVTAIRDFHPDVVQLHGGRAVKYGALARALDRSGGWALVYRNIGEPERWVRGRLKRWVYRRLVMPRVDGVVAVSRATLAALESFYDLRVPRVTIPRGVDPEALAPRRSREEVRRELATPEAAPVVIWVGSLGREKRPDRLVRVAARTAERHAGVHVWVVGDGPLRADSEDMAAAAGLAQSFRWLGARERVGELIAAADVLLLTSDTEGMPGVVLEAAALGVPSVAPAIGGVPECVTDGATGLLHPPGDEAAAVAALDRLLTAPPLRTALGRAARERALREFHVDVVAARYAELYREVLARRRSRTAAA